MKTPSGIPIDAVFTPRNHEVNEDMYIRREHHEKRLKRAVLGSMHTIVSGASGTGKSWLCKKVCKEESWKTRFANCANANRLGSITKEIYNCIIEQGTQIENAYEQEIDASVNTVVVKGGAKTKRTYTITSDEELEKAFSFLRKQAKSKHAVVVLDNLEAVFANKELSLIHI